MAGLVPAVTDPAGAVSMSVGTYDALVSALNSAADGDVITLTSNISATANVTFDSTGKTVTFDGGHFTLTGPDGGNSCGLTLSGSGTVILKDITLQGSGDATESYGLYIPIGSSVNAIGGNVAADFTSSYGVYNQGGTINVTNAVGGSSTIGSCGVYTAGGTVNVTNATGGNEQSGSIEMSHQSFGILCNGGTVNVTNAASGNSDTENGSSYGVRCISGTVNVTAASFGNAHFKFGVYVSGGTVNMGSETIFLTAGDGILNSGANVATLTLHKPMGAECVLNSITVAKNSHTVVGALPAVVCNGAASADWYLNSGTKAGSTVGQGTTDLYSQFEFEARIGGTYYMLIQNALNGAVSGDTVTLLRNITATANVTLDSNGKTVTLDGGNFTLTGPNGGDSYGLTLSGSGTVILKNITLQGGDNTTESSCGIFILPDSAVDVLSSSTVNALGGDPATGSSYGVYNFGSGTVNVTNATGGTATAAGHSFGVWSSLGTVNSTTATGGTVTSGISTGVYNVGGAVNVTTATGGTITTEGHSYGVYTVGMVNVTNATGGNSLTSYGVYSFSGVVNAETCSGSTDNTYGPVNTGANAQTLTLHRRSGAECVLDSITVAATGDTTVGTLPVVFYNGTYSGSWYTDSALSNPFTCTYVSDTQRDLYSGANVYTVSGRVTDSGGGGLAAALQLKDSSGASVGSIVNAALDGTYTINGVTVGTGYTIAVRMNGYLAGTISTFNITDTDAVKNLTLTAVSNVTPYYRIAATQSAGGTVALSASYVARGAGITVTVTPDEDYEIKDVLVDGVSVGAISPYTIANIDADHTVSALFEKIVINPFLDVASDEWFYDSVLYVYSKGLMTGISSDMFSPNGTTTRAMVLTVLYRLSGDTGSYMNNFTDVPSGAWYEKAAAWAAANGIASGTGNNALNPNGDLTREQIAVMLCNYANYKGYDVSAGHNTSLDGFPDASLADSYASIALQWAVGSGIITGDTSGNLNPQSSATRAEVAVMLQRFIATMAI
jgi:hypothetical protein